MQYLVLLSLNRYQTGLPMYIPLPAVMIGVVLLTAISLLVLRIQSLGSQKIIRGLSNELSVAKSENSRISGELNVVLKSRDVFTANLSHELRTPANGVCGMAHLLLNTHLDEVQQRYASAIYHCTASMMTTLGDILDYADLKENTLQLTLRPFHLRSEVLGYLDQMITSMVFRRVFTFKTAIDADVPDNYIGDPDRLLQVLINLTGNAIKFSEPDHLTISVKSTESSADSVTLRFGIYYDGKGFPNAYKESMFQPFSQADQTPSRLHEGTGLGLHITGKLIELMGGNIIFNHDTEMKPEVAFDIPFRIIINDIPDSAEPDLDLNLHAIPVEKYAIPYSILLVEDNDISRDIELMFLKLLGLDAVTVENGKKSIETLAEKHFDLILMDCQMPVMDGFTATRIIRSLNTEYASIPIIALTANVTDADKAECLSCGMNDFLPKPFNLKTLRSTLAKWLPKPDNTPSSPTSGPENVATKQPSQLPVWNRGHFLDQVENDPTIAETIITEFIKAIPHLTSTLERSLDSGDAVQIHRSAHSIKGAASMIAADALSEAARRLEFMAEKRQSNEFNHYYSTIKNEFDRLRTVLENR